MDKINAKNLNVNLQTKSKVLLPASMLETHYSGLVYGYYVNETKIFNVLPAEVVLDRKYGRGNQIGYIAPNNSILEEFPNCREQIKWLTPTSGSPIDSIREKIKVREKGIIDLSNPFFDVKGSNIDFNGCCSNLLNIEGCYDISLLGFWEGDQLKIINTDCAEECKIKIYSLKQDVFSRNTGIIESDIMQDKGALFVGCGSVGSNAALELAKAGVGRFMLVDDDIFEYHNICRHQCGIYDVGYYKAEALCKRILMVNPYAEVVVKKMTIQDVPLAEIDNFCYENTIVIGGADNREGDLYANKLAKRIGMPFMSIGCWERAFAGEIFYCLPTGMPDYEDFVTVTGTLSGRVSQNRHFYTTEDDLRKVTFEPGISVDVDFVTIIAVKLAIDILNRNSEHYTQRLLPYLTQYTLVCNTNNTKIGGEWAEIFSYPLQVTTSIKVPYANKTVKSGD